MALLRRPSREQPAKPASDSVAKTVAFSASIGGTAAGSSSTSTTEAVDHPSHYNASPSGIECIDVVETMPFNIGNAIKYLWRCDHKGKDIEDLRKALWYVQREIDRRTKANGRA